MKSRLNHRDAESAEIMDKKLCELCVFVVRSLFMRVLMISLDKSLATNPEGDATQRHLEYAERAGKLTIITYSSRLPLREGQDGVVRSSPHLTIIPTNSRSRLTYLLDAYRLGSNTGEVDLITTQDPFVTGLVGVWLRRKLRAPLLVQNHSLNAIGVQPADVVIEPDVTGFDLTEFMRAKELAAIGEAAAREQIPKIRQLLARLDPQLFRPSGDVPELPKA